MEIEGILAAGFTDVSGLSIQTEVDTIKEGGVNDHEHKLPRGTKYSDITLKRGLVDCALWDWYQSTVNSTAKEKIERKSGTISLRDHSGNTVFSWFFFDAFPSKWEGPTLNAASNTVASETLVLTHHGLQKELYHPKH